MRYNVPIYRNKALKVCESITDFLDSSKFAKILKNCTSPYRTRMMQYEYKKENRKRIEKRDIKLRKIFKKVFRNMNLEIIFHVRHVYSMIKVFVRKDY